ncbi:flagellar hook-length control protein FliK [Sphingomonas sp. PP-F2F-A104-K0414]|uniref:flagellar hook-length control protein FliK n=1 Tax=Sphingomonas sp. PP-F2F-A104-K0414 TaxID=2135661 RepID=UPI001049CC22|nr:flagellar hook-length control protein FliK [Sphingomonas sp. PP-F2F-A104-K0414]TCP95465.1 flagellar hook-length control protein FliK [Sphingomonas sp. PP-F2F-A104-K0414]
MIQTATLSPMLPAQARSTTVPNGPTPGDFAGSFAQANDDAAAEGEPTTPAPIVAIPAPSAGTIVRQDAAATGNTLPTPIVTEAAQPIVPAIVTLLAEPLAAGLRPTSPTLVQPIIPATPEPATPDIVKRTIAPRPSPSAARPAAFAIAPRGGKAKNDTPTTPSDDTADATLADQPALPDQPMIAQPTLAPPLAQANPDIPLVASPAPSPPPEAAKMIVAENAVAPAGSAIVGAKPSATGAADAKPLVAAEPDLTTSITPAPRQSRSATKLAQAERAVPTAIPVAPPALLQNPIALRPVAQPSALPVATASPQPAVGVVDRSQISPREVTPVALTPATPVITTPVAAPPLQIVALAGTVPVAPQISSVSPPLGLASEPGSTAQSSLPAPDADTAPATPRWVATDATTPVALTLAQPAAIQPQPGTVASASQVFGAAIQAATKARDERDTPDPTAPSVAAGAPISAPAIKTAEAQRAPLDMRQERWPHAMIERIEILRDAAEATDTRIRLVPDALGAINVSMRKDGDTVHVHFNAEQVATRTLLADAQPRLAELAEARGLKLGQGALGDGNAGSSQQRAPAPSQIPNRTTTTAAMIADAAEDTRIA